MSDPADRPLPPQRTTDLVVRAQGEGALILDRRTQMLHYLPAEVTRVWHACNGSSSLAQVAAVVGVEERIAASAVDQLSAVGLLEAPEGIDRRAFLGRTAVVGAGAVAIPLIETVVSPSPAGAASPPTLVAVSGCDVSGRATITVMIRGLTPNTDYLVNVTYDSTTVTEGPIFTGTGDFTVTFAIGRPGQFSATPATVTVERVIDGALVAGPEAVTLGPCAVQQEFIGLGPPTVATSSSGTNPGRFIVDYPSATQRGDLLLLIVVPASNNGEIFPPATWTQIARVPTPNNPRFGLTVYWKIAGDETSVGTVANGATDASGIVAWVADYRGPTTPNGTVAFGSSGPNNVQPSTFTPSPDIQTTASDATAISIVAVREPNTLSLSAPAGFTEDRTSTFTHPGTGDPVKRTLALAHELRPSPGTVPSPTWLQAGSPNGRWAFVTVAFV